MARDAARRKSIVDAMRDEGICALFCYTPADVLLVSGYWPVMGASLALATPDGAVHVILPEDEMELAEATSDAHLLPYKPETLQSLTSAAVALVDPLKRLARSLKLECGQLGLALEDGMQAVPYQSVNRFRESLLTLVREAFYEVEISPADELIERLKAQHTAIELDQIRRACRLAHAGFAAAPAAIAAGRREDEVAAEIEAAFLKVANDGFERGGGTFFCMSGPNAAKAQGAYARTRRRILEAGDFVMIHANTTGDGFWTDITRNYVVGAMSDRQQTMRAAIAEARAAALATIRPGVYAREVDAAARSVLKDHGFGREFTHAVGHGVGFAAANPNAIPRLHPQSSDRLAAGMTFNIEPAIYLDGVGGMRHCDVVACTGEGAEVLTDFQPI